MAMTDDDLLDGNFTEHHLVAKATPEAVREPFNRLVARSVEAVRAGHKLLFFGNGGSAADAQHLATELTVRYINDRAPIAALALTTDSSALTAIGNDLGYDALFARQIEALGLAGDVAIGFSTSGRSPNIIKGLEMARSRGLTATALTGAGGGDLVGLANPLLMVPSTTTARIQEMHITLGHALCAGLERGLGMV
jgi:D-sedoheptulose 7-phosphate isomerase